MPRTNELTELSVCELNELSHLGMVFTSGPDGEPLNDRLQPDTPANHATWTGS